ncbi:caspase family protein, partial [Paractinoplanes durhamensis]
MTTPSEDPPRRLPDPLRSRAVLVGPAEYQHLSPLASISANVHRLRELLTDETVWGLPESHCVTLTDAASSDDVHRALLAAGREAEDTLVFYFAGHGFLQHTSARLFLALGNAETDSTLGAIEYDRIKEAVLSSECPSKVVILDCCYAGNATLAGPNEFADQTVVDGTYLLTSCGENSLSVSPPGEQYTAFTGALVRLLDEGIPGRPDLLSTADVYWWLRNELSGTDRPVPMQRSGNRGHHIVLAVNRALSRPPAVT